MEKIKKFFECLVPVTACNFKCSYCYIIQREHRSMEIPKLKYSIEQIGQALRKERMGGTCYFSICGAGETLMADQIVELVREILKQGHYVNITTNGTLTKQFKKICEFPMEFLNRLHFSFSLHYLELLRLNKLGDFFENIKMVKDNGASFMVQINLCDEYEPYLEEIKAVCKKNIGAYPQVAATRKEYNINNHIELLTEHSIDEYKEIAKSFESPLFDFTMLNFNVKRREFCYAGDWSGVLNFNTGILRKCYSDNGGVDIFKNPEKQIKFFAIGRCESLFCMNSSHFMSLGIIPELYKDITYQKLRNRANCNWYNETMKKVLDGKLRETNNEYSEKQKVKILRKEDNKIRAKKIKNKAKKVIKKLLNKK